MLRAVSATRLTGRENKRQLYRFAPSSPMVGSEAEFDERSLGWLRTIEDERRRLDVALVLGCV
jgi:hypothetical protein